MRLFAVSEPTISTSKPVALPPAGTKCVICGNPLRKFWSVLPSGAYADARCYGGGR